MDSFKFVTAEKSFIEEEMDTLAVLKGLQQRQRNIESDTLSHNRKYLARKLLQAIVDNNWEEDFISIVRERHMELILNRYETFTKVYSSGRSISGNCHLFYGLLTFFLDLIIFE